LRGWFSRLDVWRSLDMKLPDFFSTLPDFLSKRSIGGCTLPYLLKCCNFVCTVLGVVVIIVSPTEDRAAHWTH